MKIAFYTSITNSYFAKARILAQSVKHHYPDSYFILALLDQSNVDLCVSEPSIDEVWKIAESDFPNFSQWIYTHDVVEACTAQKGFALQTFLRRNEFDAVVYLDPDIRVFSRMLELENLLEQGLIVVTPHLTAPSKERLGIEDNEFAALQHGAFNLGFVAVPNTPDGLKVADWWDQRLRRYCYDEKSKGLFTDQKWFDLVPGMFDSVEILRHPGYNLATWNIEHRRLDRVGGQLEVNGQALRFIHFSGYDSGAHHSMIDAYAADQHVFKELSSEYEDLLRELFVSGVDDQEWFFKRNTSKELIPRAWRRKYRDNLELRTQFPNPFELTTAHLTHTDPLDPLSLAVDNKLLSDENLNSQLDVYRVARTALLKRETVTTIEFKTLNVERINQLLKNDRKTIALIEHGLGGGLEVHAKQLSDLLINDVNVLRISAHQIDERLWELRIQPLSSIGSFGAETAIGTKSALHDALALLEVDRFHLHSAYRSEEFWLPFLLSSPISFDVTIHDFTLLTTNWSMEDGTGRTYPIDDQIGIIKSSFQSFPWKSDVFQILNRAARTIFPSRAARRIFEECVAVRNPITAYHPEFPYPERIPVDSPTSLRPNSRGVRVAVLGDLASHKGLHVVHDLASKYSNTSSPLEIFHFGEKHPHLGNLVRSIGRYERTNIATQLRRLGIQVVVLPSQVHETYGYALTDAMLGQLPIVASNVGAFPERLADRPWSRLVDANCDAKQWTEAIQSVLRNGEPAKDSMHQSETLVESRNFYRSEYI